MLRLQVGWGLALGLVGSIAVQGQDEPERLDRVRAARRAALEAEVVMPDLAELGDLQVDYGRDVRPLLSENCFACHGHDEGSRQAGVRLDRREDALRRNRVGKAPIVPGDLESSRVAWRLFHPDPKVRMPPPAAEKPLSDRDRKVLARWILDGADYETHWAYREIETTALVATNPVDHYVALGLGDSGLAPSPPAAPRILARRLTLDLVGLPPSAVPVAPLVERYLAGPSEDSYLRLVDDLLALPQYGERMAVHWLDLVRYADTNGYHSDEPRRVSPYRDWVIRAFNANMPFDQFTIEQVAGDLLPDPTPQQLIASTFNRLNQLTAEGGAQEKEYRAKYDADRVRAVSTVWLGATLGCAECHDHKFDPYLQRDFYAMAAFFADIEEYDVYTTGESWDPVLQLPSEAERQEIEQLDRQIAEVEAAIASSDQALAEDRARWERSLQKFLRKNAARGAPGWHPVTPLAWQTEGSELEVLADLSLLAQGANPPGETYFVEFATTQEAPTTALRLEILGHPSLRGGLARARRGGAELGELELERLGPDGEWLAVPFSAAFDDRSSGTNSAALVIDGTTSSRWTLGARRPIDDRVQAAFLLESPLDARPGTRLRVRQVHHGLNNRTAFGRIRYSLTSDEEPQFAEEEDATRPRPSDGVPGDVLEIVRLDEDQRSREQRLRVQEFYRLVAPALEEERRGWVQLHERRLEVVEAQRSTLATRAIDQPRTTRILERGNWQTPGAVVEPAVPAFLPPLEPRAARPDRLDLARWLVDGRHPLPSRVVVNRFFALFFGRGLAPVLGDLGAQGGVPSHPELLDELARGYLASGWDTKALVRTLVTSRTYRQSSQPTPELRERDPNNLLLARQERLRLDAEFVRDNALAISGLLAFEIGGESVRPYQPAGYWRNANTFGGSSLAYDPSEGSDQYRRGLYTYWKRSFLHPSLLAFDAPSREECTADREVSNTPLQALVLLNDPSYVEAARVLAESLLREGGTSDSERLDWLFERALLRDVLTEESVLLVDLLDRHRDEYERDVGAVEALLSIGQSPRDPALATTEVAAWTSVTRAVLNLPEVITRF